MKVKRLSLLVVSICLVLMFVSLSLIAEEALAQTKTYNWKMTSSFPPGHNLNRSIIEFAKTLEQRTNGAVKITVYEGTLGAPPDAWDMVTTNAVTFTFMGEAYHAGRLPIVSMLNLPFEIPDYYTLSVVLNEWFKAGYLKELTNNFKLLYFMPINRQNIFMRNKKVSTMDDIRGLKISSVSGIQGQTVTALGATGVSMPGAELYMALSTGILDGTITGIDNVVDRKLYEVIKYGLNFAVYGGTFMFVMNKETWNSLPKDLQALIEQISQDVVNPDIQKRRAEEPIFWETVRQKNVETYTLSPEEQARWKKATVGVTDKYVQEWATKGHPTKEALDLMRKVVSVSKK